MMALQRSAHVLGQHKRIVLHASPVRECHEDPSQVADGDALRDQSPEHVGQHEQGHGLRNGLGDQLREDGLDLPQHLPGLVHPDEVSRLSTEHGRERKDQEAMCVPHCEAKVLGRRRLVGRDPSAWRAIGRG